MCYTVLKATGKCKKGHIVSVRCCFRQCEKIPALDDPQNVSKLCFDVETSVRPFVREFNVKNCWLEKCETCDNIQELQDNVKEAEEHQQRMERLRQKFGEGSEQAKSAFESGRQLTADLRKRAISDEQKFIKVAEEKLKKDAISQFDALAPVFYQGPITETESLIFPAMARKKSFQALSKKDPTDHFPEMVVDWTLSERMIEWM